MKLLTTPQVAQIFNVTPQAVQGWIRDGKLKAGHTPGGRYRVSLEEVNRFLQEMGLPEVSEERVE